MAGASVPWPVRATAAIGGVPGRAERFPAHGTCRGCPGCDATARVDRGAARAHHLNGPSKGGGGGGGRGQLAAVWPLGVTHNCTGVHRAVQARVVALR